MFIGYMKYCAIFLKELASTDFGVCRSPGTNPLWIPNSQVMTIHIHCGVATYNICITLHSSNFCDENA